MTFLTIKHIAVRSLLTWLFLRTLGLIISRCYHLQTNGHSCEKFAVSLAGSYLSLRLQVKDFSFLDSFHYTRNETFRVRPLWRCRNGWKNPLKTGEVTSMDNKRPQLILFVGIFSPVPTFLCPDDLSYALSLWGGKLLHITLPDYNHFSYLYPLPDSEPHRIG